MLSSRLARHALLAAALAAAEGGCFNTDKTCADLGKVPTCNVGAQAGTAGTAGTAGAGSGGTGAEPAGGEGGEGARTGEGGSGDGSGAGGSP